MKIVSLILILLLCSCGLQNDRVNNRQDDSLDQGVNATQLPLGFNSSNQRNIILASYNFHGIPNIAKQNEFTKYNVDRSRAFLSILWSKQNRGTLPDVLMLQEIFSPTIFKMLVSGSPYNYGYSDHTGNFNVNVNIFDLGNSNLTGSGLLVLSKYPISRANIAHFPERLCAIEDCFSRKGVTFTEIHIPGISTPLEIYNTHMQSGANHNDVRRGQLNFMKAFHQYSSRNRLGVLVGDFNFREFPEGERRLIDYTENLFTSRNLTRQCRSDDQCTYYNDGVRNYDNVLDHYFLYGIESHRAKVKSLQSVFLNYRRSGSNHSLSDHPYLEVRMRIN